MEITEYTPQGKNVRTASLNELKQYAKKGNKEAIRELINISGGYTTLTPLQKDKVIQLLLNYEVDLL